MQRFLLWMMALCIFGLSSCGTKGDLYLPQKDNPKTSQTVTS